MERSGVRSGLVVEGAMAWREVYGRSARYARGSFIGLGLVSALVAEGKCAVQGPGRLSVRPHETAVGTRNGQAGEQRLDSLVDYLVYVPPQAVGTRRVPLVVLVPGGGQDAKDLTTWHRPLADKYGMIVLAATGTGTGTDVAAIDAAIKQVLRKFAIDPDKIAVAGSSDGGFYSLYVGSQNLDVFSRIAPMSSNHTRPVTTYPRNTTTRFFFSGSSSETMSSLAAVQALRQAGHPVEQVLIAKGHEQRLEDYDHMWSWLQESWTKPDPASRPDPRAGADSVPLLTIEAVTQMATFWARFAKQPDLVRTFGRRRKNQKQMIVPVGREWLSLVIMDMVALAAKYPPIAADLRDVGLTAQQHDAYRAAIVSARATARAIVQGLAEPVAANSVLGKNVAFSETHLEEISSIRMGGVP